MSSLTERYSLTQQVQETPSARVFRGYRSADLVPVMVKRPRSEQPSELEILRLEHEYAILRSIQSPYVARALSLEKSGNALAVVLEDAGETSVESLVRGPPLELSRALELSVSLASAVAAVHEHSIVHKDVKPQHFFVSRDRPGHVKLIDFGIATRLPEEASFVTALHELEGSPAYIAPEQTGRMNRVVDQRSDLYSLGVTLYELFTGRLPFEAEDVLELVHAHIARTPVPPHRLRSELPPVVSEIVLRLLAKSAEERYQSARGLSHDLARCLAAAQSSSAQVASFELGTRDRSRELRIPQKLYGRTAELMALLARFDAVRTGSRELFLLSGYSGVGKSALVRELERHLALGGHFVSGKFESLNRSVPYAAIARACGDLLYAILAEPERDLERRRQSLTRALGANASVLSGVIPALELVLGPQPDAPAVGPNEVQLRFELAFENFFASLASGEEPLLVFLDDLQWADPASLRLVERLLTGSACRHLLIVGAYRSNELEPLHPLRLALEQIRAVGGIVTELELGPLAAEDVTELVADTVGATLYEARPLSRLLLDKTHGNPFFLGQFLKTLHREGALYFDDASGCFRWELSAVERTVATDNVIEFLLARLRNLPEATQDLLRLAACIGHRFDVKTLVAVSRRSPRQVMSELWAALSGGFVVPLDTYYRYAEVLPADEHAPPNASYRFLHDRVQQAAYALIDEERKAEAHLGIGRMLVRSTPEAHKHESLFEIVDHLNRGRRSMNDADELRRVALLNLSAGVRARNAAAPAAAARYLDTALELLGREAFASSYEYALQATFLLAECSFVTGKMDHAFRLLDELEQNARTTLDRVLGRNLRGAALTFLGRLREACLHGVETARLLGADLPDPDDHAALNAAIGAAFADYQAALGGRPIETLADLPPMTDANELALLDTYAAVIPQAFQSNQQLMALLVLRAVALPLEHGTAPTSAFFYEQYGIVHSLVTGDYATAYRFGELGIRLIERAGTAERAGPVHFIFAGFVSHWSRHLSESLEHFKLGLRYSLEAGDQFHANYCAGIGLNYRLYSGENLDGLDAARRDVDKLLERTDDVVNKGFVTACRQAVAALKLRTLAPHRFQTADFDEASFVASASPPVLGFYGAARALLCLLAGEVEEAVRIADTFTPLPNLFYCVYQRFCRGLALLELARRERGSAREALLARFAEDCAAIESWAASSPDNHAHRAALMRAELATLTGPAGTAEAMAAYDEAIALARRNGFVQDQAFAAELCARFHLAHARDRVARPYLVEAAQAYRRWGATSKLDELRTKYGALLQLGEAAPFRLLDARSTSYEVHSLELTGALDLTAAVRALEAVATELVLENVLERLMRTLIGSAGAQRGFLALERAGELVLVASLTLDPDLVRLNLELPVDASDELCTGVVQYVARTQQSVTLADAVNDPRFGNDPYVVRQRPKSVLCVPMLHRRRLIGVLYLENNSATSAFSPARASFLQFLAAQAAVAVENAKLYGELNAATERLRRTNETLEAEVAERTAELRRALADLWTEVDLAKKIQTVLLPNLERAGDYELAAAMLTAESVGGDYYDLIELGERQWVMIGDVSGHGVTAGLIMMMVQTAIRTVVATAHARGERLSPAQVLSRANAAVRPNLRKVGEGQYMTICALELAGSRVRFAGLHQDILVYRAGARSVERVPTRGVWLGLIDDASELLEDDALELSPGDQLLLFTDGLTERKLGDARLGTAGLATRFEALAGHGLRPRPIVEALLGELGGSAGRDDVTLLALGYFPGPSVGATS